MRGTKQEQSAYVEKWAISGDNCAIFLASARRALHAARIVLVIKKSKTCELGPLA